MVGNFACFLLSDFFLKIVLQKTSGIPLLCQTIWIQIRNDVLLGLNWIQTVCYGNLQMTLAYKKFSFFFTIGMIVSGTE